MTAEIIARLVETHGEGGLCPSAADWTAIFAIEGTVHVLNLLEFSPGGAASYRRYAAAVEDAFNRAGGVQLFFGPIGHAFGTEPTQKWDAAILTRYPSAGALATM